MAISEETQRASVFETGGSNDAALGMYGMAIDRLLPMECLAGALRAAQGIDAFTPYTWCGVNELSRYDVRAQGGLTDVLSSDADKEVRGRVGSLACSLDVYVEGVGVIPRGGKDSIVIIDLTQRCQGVIIDERDDVLEVLESLNPQSNYDWRDYYRPGIPVGTLRAGNRAWERREVRTRIHDRLSERFTLQAARILPDPNDPN